MTPLMRNRFCPALFVAIALSACSTMQPTPYTDTALAEQGAQDRAAARQNVEPIAAALSLEDALARALKYNLDRRSKMMEEALAFKQLDVSHYDMLPKLLAQTGYSWRNNDKVSMSRNSQTGLLSESQFVSQDREHVASSLGLTWSLLDLGLGYYNTRQQADRVLIAAEKRRKAMHLLMQDVRTAFWRAFAAQKLRGEVLATTRMADEALADSRKAESERLRNPVDALRYQRQLLENLRLLEAIDQELSTARIELAALINAPVAEPFTLIEPAVSLNRQALEVPAEVMEDKAMTLNADVREQHYNARIAHDEVRRTLVRLFPNITFNYNANYDTDHYLLNNSWRDAGIQLSFNLFNLFTGPNQMKLAEAGVKLADQRRVAMQMAVVAQVHLARQQYASALSQFERAEAIWQTDNRIAAHMKNREAAQIQGKLETVASQTTTILSLLRRYQALGQAQSAEARLQSTIGIEPAIGSVDEVSIADLARKLSQDAANWRALSAAKDGAHP
jgi:outer membrane protein TolC